MHQGYLQGPLGTLRACLNTVAVNLCGTNMSCCVTFPEAERKHGDFGYWVHLLLGFCQMGITK